MQYKQWQLFKLQLSALSDNFIFFETIFYEIIKLFYATSPPN